MAPLPHAFRGARLLALWLRGDHRRLLRWAALDALCARASRLPHAAILELVRRVEQPAAYSQRERRASSRIAA